MPRYYCDYCDTYLTHDSPSVRKQHNAGYKHKANVRTYYQQFEEQQTQSIIDQKVKEHQHMAAFQGFKPMVPVLPRPGMGLPGSSPAPMLQPMRPPVIHPGAPGGGYPSGPGGFRLSVGPVPGNTQQNGVYRPMTPPGARPPPGASNGMPASGGGYSQQPIVPGQTAGGGGASGGGGAGAGPGAGPGAGGGGGGFSNYSSYSQPPPAPGYGSQPPPPRPGMSSGYGYSQPPPGSGD